MVFGLYNVSWICVLQQMYMQPHTRVIHRVPFGCQGSFQYSEEGCSQEHQGCVRCKNYQHEEAVGERYVINAASWRPILKRRVISTPLPPPLCHPVSFRPAEVGERGQNLSLLASREHRSVALTVIPALPAARVVGACGGQLSGRLRPRC